MNEEQLRAHLSTDEPGGHGLDGAVIASMPITEMQAKHDSLHAGGAEHGHEASETPRTEQPYRDGLLVRSLAPTFEYEDGESVRAVALGEPPESGGGLGHLMGRFAVFDTWTEVRSMIEGHFMERTAEYAFRKTLQEARPPIIFNHGFDHQFGTKPLAPTEDVGTDTRGGYYGGDLLDTSYNKDLIPGLRAGLYGSSFRFRTTKPPEVQIRPKPSNHNPKGIPEVTILEAAIKEFGPGMFPVYPGTNATVRSETDSLVLSRFGDPEQIRAFIQAQEASTAPLIDGAEAEPHSDEGSRTEPPPAAPIIVPAVMAVPQRFRSRDEWLAYLEERHYRNA